MFNKALVITDQYIIWSKISLKGEESSIKGEQNCFGVNIHLGVGLTTSKLFQQFCVKNYVEF